MLKKLLSYFTPIVIHQKKSAVSKNLEITWNNGALVIDSQNTNYSYGSLQRILKKGLKTIGFDRISAMEHILILGVAGGSVIKTLTNDVKFKRKITGVEIDADVIELANQYFALDSVENLTIVIDDAFEFALKTRDRYDLIIIDVFCDTEMPNFLFEKFFINRICFLLNSKGIILFNTMLLSESHRTRNKNYISEFEPSRFKIKKVPGMEYHNELLIVEKLY